MSKIRRCAQAQPPGAKSRNVPPSRWVFFFFFDVILMGMNRSGSNKSRDAQHTRCGEYGEEWMRFHFLLGFSMLFSKQAITDSLRRASYHKYCYIALL